MGDGKADAIIMKRFLVLTQSALLCLMGWIVAGRGIAMVAGYTMTLQASEAYAATVAICAVAAVLAAKTAGVQELKASLRCLPVLLPLSLAYGIVLFELADWKHIGVSLLVTLICCTILYRKCARKMSFARACKVMCTFLVPLILFFAMTAMTDFVMSTVVESVHSPEGRYEALLIDVDEGALGGSTVVDVRDNDAIIDMGILRFGRMKCVYLTDWGAYEDMQLSWLDEHTLLIDGQPYSM